jgi:hypothetical protein
MLRVGPAIVGCETPGRRRLSFVNLRTSSSIHETSWRTSLVLFGESLAILDACPLIRPALSW